MKKSIEIPLSLSLFGLLLFTIPAYAHHPAADIVDAEIYAIIDELVSDTPHADLVFDDNMGGGDTMLAITASLRSLEELVDDGLLSEVSELSGEVSITIEFADRGNDVVLTITQLPE
ncbi:MAG: hypothetical protein GY799_14825 [Desulfobulbaceae bacterium]|nr:hypothetical protein [Desulfobulbaceae bacterium]